MYFRILGLDPAPFRHYYGQPDTALAASHVRRYVADTTPGFPDRIELRDVEPGESVLLLNYTHQSGATPYRASHAIFVREGAETPFDAVDTIPSCLRSRMLSVRGFDRDDMMVDADLAEGAVLEDTIARMLSDPAIAYLHAHYAKRGCFAARIHRA
jgi:hypothetical protein